MDARLLATYERLLSDPDSTVRLDAAAGLARSDVEAGVKAYLGLSTDPDSSVALLAADGLAGLGRRQLAVDACLLVADRDPESKLAAAARLADLGRAGLARDVYAENLDSLPADLALTAADALGLLDFPGLARIGYQRAVLAGQPQQVLAAAAGLERVGEFALAINAYAKLNGGVYFSHEILAAAQRLDAAGTRVDTWPLYWGLLQNELAPPAAKLTAAEVLRRRPWPIAPEMVAADRGWPSFAAARKLEETQPTQPLIQEVWARESGSPDLDLALAVGDRLINSGHESRVLNIPHRALESGSATQVLAGATLLRRIDPRVGPGTLGALATDAELPVAVEAVRRLDPGNPQDLEALNGLLGGRDEVAVEAAERLASGPTDLLAEEELIRLIGSSQEAVRMRIAPLLERRGLRLAMAEYASVESPEFAPLVLDAGRRLADEEGAVVLFATALPLLTSDADRDEAFDRLQRLDPRLASEVNQALLRAESPSLRSLRTAARLDRLGEHGAAIVEYRRLVGVSDRTLALEAARLLGAYDLEEAIAAYRRVADGDDATALAAAQHLAELGDVEYVRDAVDQLLSSPYSGVALQAADLLHGLQVAEPEPETPPLESGSPPVSSPIAAVADVRLGLRPFISYSGAHAGVAVDLDAALRQRGLDPWTDLREVLPGTSAAAAVREGVHQSTSLVVIVSESSSREQAQHWDLAAAEGKPIVPVLTGTAVPVRLSELHGIRFQGDIDALADSLYQQSGVALDPPEPPSDLVTALEAGEVVVFTGVDLAAQAGYPTRRKHVTDLLQWFEGSAPAPADPGLLQSLQAGLRLGEVDSVGDALAGMISPAAFQEQAALAFGQERSSRRRTAWWQTCRWRRV